MPKKAREPRSPANRGRKLPPEPLSARGSHGSPPGVLPASPDRGAERRPPGRDVPRRAPFRRSARPVPQGRGPQGVAPSACSTARATTSRVIGLDAGAFALVERWLDRRKTLGLNCTVPLFCTLDGKPLDTSYVRHAMKRLAKRAGIEKRVHPHGLRHTHAAELAREGVPMNVIQAQLGHSSLATTSRYLAHVAPQQVVEAMQARKWDLNGDRRSEPNLCSQVRRSASHNTDEDSTARDGGDR